MLATLGTLLGFVPFVVIYLVAVALLTPPIEEAYIWNLALIALGATIARFVMVYFSLILSHMAAFEILFGIKRSLVDKLGRLPLGYLSTRTSGGVKKIISEDVDRIELFIAHHVPPDVVSGVVLPIVTVIFLFTIDWRLALAALIPIPPLAFIAMSRAYQESASKSMKGYYDALEKMNGIIIEYVRGMPVVKVFNQTARSFSRLQDSVYGYRDYVNRWTREVAPAFTAFGVCINLPILFILPPGIWFYITGSLELPVLILFLILGVGYMYGMMKMMMFAGFWRQINEGVERIDAILNEPDLPSPQNPKIPDEYSVRFNEVKFAYGKNPVLTGVSFDAPAGTVTALVGPSGAGKSTAAQLIPRFWDVDAGSISIGGVDIREIDPEKLMDMVSFVFQDLFMFHDTIEENIRMGNAQVAKEEVIAAARAAQADDFIRSLPDGYDTITGSGGTYLSGGEQQRIILARAILKNAPIIVLDEATAFADPENESRIQEAFSHLMREKTVIIIAHRLSTIADANQIVVIDDGRVAECGHHEELLEKDGLYARMWNAHISARTWRLSTGGAV
ncbi:ABC transporter ATP-binding protein [Methanogenium cariaci]|uniref:ABC transporter ATP-binding protein n=1 Tax=Methanogenium cariaci TaxID=2197 RepID=UPI000B063690|nr:ABC transporter ATP-binding protein [Methanogenium cariaci]